MSECTICFEEINNEENFCVLKCKHKFHATCMLKWAKSCPLCRDVEKGEIKNEVVDDIDIEPSIHRQDYINCLLLVGGLGILTTVIIIGYS